MERNYLGFLFYEEKNGSSDGNRYWNYYPFATLETSESDRRIVPLSKDILRQRFTDLRNINIWERSAKRREDVETLKSQLENKLVNGGLYCLQLNDANVDDGGMIIFRNERKSCTVNWSDIEERIRDARICGIYPVIDREAIDGSNVFRRPDRNDKRLYLDGVFLRDGDRLEGPFSVREDAQSPQRLIIDLSAEHVTSDFPANDAVFRVDKVYPKRSMDWIGNVDITYVDTRRPSVRYREALSRTLLRSKNLILHGAPGTGKTFLGRRIAADIVSHGATDDYTRLTDAQRAQVAFVQFHPGYDYSDFVEGLRPVLRDGSVGFERRDGVFMSFVKKAMKDAKQEDGAQKDYVFIIDEINRGEISKIFGELFFSIDPEYRGRAGEVSTQYANMHNDPNEKFCVPENVYIIGTMNDIDRSVDSFDFAMRRRFRFLELRADDERARTILDMLEDQEKREDALRRMDALNSVIAGVKELNRNYQVGPAYFLKLRDLTLEELWEDNLAPLLREYVRGMFNEKELMQGFENAYFNGGQNEAQEA